MAKGEWKTLELPDKNVKVEHCSCDNTGSFSLIITDKGVAYFGGLNKKGEAGEARKMLIFSLKPLPTLFLQNSPLHH